MLTITSPIFDVEGSETIASPEPEGLSGFQRRNSRVATLDARAVFNDFGYSDADRTLEIRWKPSSQRQIDNIVRMIKAYSRLIVSFREGCFMGVPGSFSISDDKTQLQILVDRRLDQ
tara:strand:+ start:193 stop:543 length:351 start_codon:yes stop_codon:yes gene_type:complete